MTNSIHITSDSGGRSCLPIRVLEAGCLGYVLSIPFGQHYLQGFRQLLVAVVLIAFIAHRFLAGGRHGAFRRYSMVFPLLFFLGSTVLSISTARFPVFSLKSSLYLPIALVFFFAMQEFVVSIAAVRRAACVMGIVVFLLAVDALLQYISGVSLLGSSEMFRGRVTGSVPHPNDLVIVSILIPFALAPLWPERPGCKLAAALILVTLALSTVIVSQSRNACLGLAAGLFCMLSLNGRKRGLVIAFIYLALGFALAYVLDLGNIQLRVHTLGNLSSEGRIGIWLAAWEMFKDAPITGQGPHVFGLLYLDYLQVADLPSDYHPEVAYIPWAHNIYLEMLAEQGSIGLASLLLILGVAFRSLRQSFNACARNAEIRAYLAGLAGSLVSIIAMGCFDLTFLKDWFCLLFWIIIAMIAAAGKLSRGSGVEAFSAE